MGARVGDSKPIEAPYMIIFSVLPITLVLSSDLFLFKKSFQPEL